MQRPGVNKDLQVAGAAAAEQTGKRGRVRRRRVAESCCDAGFHSELGGSHRQESLQEGHDSTEDFKDHTGCCVGNRPKGEKDRREQFGRLLLIPAKEDRDLCGIRRAGGERWGGGGTS